MSFSVYSTANTTYELFIDQNSDKLLLFGDIS